MLYWHSKDDNIMIDYVEGASGKRKSGLARMAKLSPIERSELAGKAAAMRWATSKQTVHNPIAIGELPIIGHAVPCAVLMINDEPVRVVSERAMMKSFGNRRGPGSHWLRVKEDPEAAHLPAIISAANLRDCISPKLKEALDERYLYRMGPSVAHGLRGELYPMICEVYLTARDKGLLLPRQEEIAKAADILMRALAHTGITALIDEATGYQKQRSIDALARILEAFIAKELQPYVKTFPADFYSELFRLRGLNYQTDSVQRPQYFGCLTNDIVYKRLAPGVLEELKAVVPRNEEGRPTKKYFQKLTSNMGYPKLREHLGTITAVMKLSNDYQDFILKLNRICPPFGQNFVLPLDYDSSQDSGRDL